ncbi:hypothetical protein R0137_03325 [Congregibacter brevis]|uniref:Uncharacterized protein n=1 Tax=Congregibacter brevis TaxID=3081201 RepID=A0ABZ0IES7_9GAMM|nr:hypothetical protein R0137_03325 [Congregibacter sp. IMCC45268]
MSIFRILKYSSLLYFLGKHRSKLARSAAVLLFAFVSSLIYDDVRIYLAQQHPGTLIYALIAKIVIVYGSLIFVLLQFRSSVQSSNDGKARAARVADRNETKRDDGSRPSSDPAAKGHLDALANLEEHDHLRSRYDRILAGKNPSDKI